MSLFKQEEQEQSCINKFLFNLSHWATDPKSSCPKYSVAGVAGVEIIIIILLTKARHCGGSYRSVSSFILSDK